MKTISTLTLFLFASTIGVAQLTYKTSWVGNTGGIPQKHIMHNVDNMYVRPDGAVYAITGWDEGALM